MSANLAFHTQTRLATGLRTLLLKLSERIGLNRPLDIYLAGGMAVHLYTAARVTTDVDAEFSLRLSVPRDMAVEVELEDGTRQALYLDTNYNSSFALMHEDYREDAIALELGVAQVRLHVLTPVDLAVSKVARLSSSDKEDIVALVALGLTTAEDIERRAMEAISGFVGGEAMLRANLRDAVALARTAQQQAGTDQS